MANESKTTTELYLGFKGSDGKSKRLVIAHPEDNLDEATTRGAMKKLLMHICSRNKELICLMNKKVQNIFNEKKHQSSTIRKKKNNR